MTRLRTCMTGPLPGGTQPEVTVLDKKIHAVFLLGDGIIGRILNDLQLAHLHLIATNLSFVFPHFSP